MNALQKLRIKKLMKDIFLKLMLSNLHNHLAFLCESMKIERVGKLVANLHDKIEYVTHIKVGALNNRLVLKKVHRTIKFNQKGWLKSYIDMNTDLRKK